MNTEPCPHCKGTGQRIVPPPPERRGRPAGSSGGPRHGYSSAYAAGCRCDLCRAAWREAARRYKNRTSPPKESR